MTINTHYKTITTTILVTISAMLIFHSIVLVGFGISLIPFPFDYDQAEGFELNNAIILSQGGCAWCDNDVFPFFASGYAPFFHILMVPFVWLFGPNFWYGRLLIFIATIATGGLITYAVWRQGKNVWIALIAGGCFLASNYIYHIAPLLRQHLLMVFFETVAVIMIANAMETMKPNKRDLLIGFLFLLCAGYTKQLAISTCIAIGLWMFIRNPRTALIYNFGLAGIAGAIFALAMIITQGHWWLNIISSNQNEYITEQFIGLATQFVKLHWGLLVLALSFSIYELYRARLSLYSVWFIVSLISTIGAGKWGAGDSYFATTLVGTSILAGITISKLLDLSSKFGIAKIFAMLSLSGVLIYSFVVFKLPTSGAIFGTIANLLSIEPKPGHRYPFYDSADWTVGYAVTGHFPSQADYEAGQQIVEIIESHEGLVISEDAGFTIVADRQVITNPIQLRNLWENDLYDATALMELIENHEVAVIIRRGDFFPVPILIAMDTNYQLSQRIAMNGFEYQIWLPKIETTP